MQDTEYYDTGTDVGEVLFFSIFGAIFVLPILVAVAGMAFGF